MKWKLFWKRFFDIAVSLLGIIITSPILLVVSILIKLTSKGPVFFRQERIGKGEKPFRILKFRTMVVNADSQGLKITVGGDKRITGVGKVLRKTKLDELPQLFNVFAGQMSLVGPRPEVAEYVALYTPEQRKVLSVRPGITDYASVCFRDENEILAEAEDPQKEYIEHIMPLKLRYNAKYIEEMGVLTDLKILFMTVYVVLGGEVKIQLD